MERGAHSSRVGREVLKQRAADFETLIPSKAAWTSILIISSNRKGVSSRAGTKWKCGYHSRAFAIRMRKFRAGVSTSSGEYNTPDFRTPGLLQFGPMQTSSRNREVWMDCTICSADWFSKRHRH